MSEDTPRPLACPICRKPVQPRFRPFCSTRCADVDLGRWLGERYVIPDFEDESGQDGEPDTDCG